MLIYDCFDIVNLIIAAGLLIMGYCLFKITLFLFWIFYPGSSVYRVLDFVSHYFDYEDNLDSRRLVENLAHIDDDDQDVEVQVTRSYKDADTGKWCTNNHTAYKPKNFQLFILRLLRQEYHIDEYRNTPVNRRVLKKRVVTLIQLNKEDIRQKDIFDNADLIVEMFFVPTDMDIRCRQFRHSMAVRERLASYNAPIYIGSWWSYLMGQPQFVDPSVEPVH